jgi:hypothetical protein
MEYKTPKEIADFCKDEKNKVGRPTKMTPELLTALNEVINDNIYCTDEELVFLLNERLTEEQRISDETFKAYKNGYRQEENELMTQFVTLIKKALIIEKNALLSELRKGEGNWQSRAWILERKFKEWNLKQISEQDINLKTDIVWNEVKNYGTDDKTD